MSSTHTLRPTEPCLSEFISLVRDGAGTLDIHDAQDDASPFTRPVQAYDALVVREVERVRIHLQSICRLLERHVGPAASVLDVGCGTGATTVAVALTPGLKVRKIVGVDPNELSLRAARARWAAYQPGDERVSFDAIAPNQSLPFADNSFDLTLCVSVIEYLGDAPSRELLARELLRVTRPGGHVCLVTPNPFRLFDYHTRRLFGDLRRTSGYPWASWPWELKRMFRGHSTRVLLSEQLEHGFEHRKFPGATIINKIAPLAWLLPWQKMIVKKA
jgi:SAM-dependent methyltransferase